MVMYKGYFTQLIHIETGRIDVQLLCGDATRV